MLLGIIAVLEKNEILTKPYLGLTPLEYFSKQKNCRTSSKEDIMFLTSDISAYKLLCNNMENISYFEQNNMQSALKDAATLLASAKNTVAKKAEAAKEIFNKHISLYYVFSEESEGADYQMYSRVAWLINLIENLYEPSLYKSMFRLYINGIHEENGVTFIDENNTYIDANVKIGKGTLIYPNVFLEGNTTVGENCILFPGCRLVNSKIGNSCQFQYVNANEATVGNEVTIGPFVNLRPSTVIMDGCKIGDFVEVKNSNIGEKTKLPHLSYIGDADVGDRTNVGCGTVFVNYDGKHKHRTIVGNDVFIGCNSNLVAPVSVGNNAYIAAGSTITDDVPDTLLAIARARQVNKQGWKPPYDR